MTNCNCLVTYTAVAPGATTENILSKSASNVLPAVKSWIKDDCDLHFRSLCFCEGNDTHWEFCPTEWVLTKKNDTAVQTANLCAGEEAWKPLLASMPSDMRAALTVMATFF